MERFVPLGGFSFECRKVIGFCMIGLNNLRQFCVQSEVKPKPIMTHSYTFSHALRQLYVISLSCDLWLVHQVVCV